MEIVFGKKTVDESYFNGELTKRVVSLSIPIKITDKVQALSEVMNALDLITNGTTNELILEIKVDSKNRQNMLMTKCYSTKE
jgi:hypothetical protein